MKAQDICDILTKYFKSTVLFDFEILENWEDESIVSVVSISRDINYIDRKNIGLYKVFQNGGHVSEYRNVCINSNDSPQELLHEISNVILTYNELVSG